MKLNKEALSLEYDRLYDKADAVLKEHDPCQIRREANGKISCTDSRRRDPTHRYEGACCQGCEHLSKDGCTVKALPCKLWLCSTLNDRQSEVYIKLGDLYREGMAVGIPVHPYGASYRTSKEQIFERMK